MDSLGSRVISSPIPIQPMEPTVNWQQKYLNCKQSLREVRHENRDLTRKSRQLIVAVAGKLKEKELEVYQLRQRHDEELTSIYQQILLVQGRMLQEKEKLESLLKDRDLIISEQQTEIDRLRSIPGGVALKGGVALERNRPGANRLHGSFRQYKRSRIQQVPPKPSDHSVLQPCPLFQAIQHHRTESTDSSSSARHASSEESSPGPTPKHRAPLRLSLSAPVIIDQPKKGILKTRSNYGSHLDDETSSILENLQRLMKQSSKVDEQRTSDSGRESDVTLRDDTPSDRSRDSGNSSFDGSVKLPPPPPPRSSRTKLTSAKKKVQFEVDTMKPLDPNFLHNLMAGEKKDISYYEPYL